VGKQRQQLRAWILPARARRGRREDGVGGKEMEYREGTEEEQRVARRGRE